MSEKDYMADPASDFIDNLQIGGSLQPDTVSLVVVKRVQTTGAKLGEVTQTLSSRVGMRHWVGKSGDATRDELEDLARTGKRAAETLDEHSKEVQKVVESATSAKSVTDQNSVCTPGVSAMEQVKAVARALQNHYHEPGEPQYPKLEYLGSPPDAPVQDRGESPDGPSGAQAKPSQGGGSPSSGGAGHAETAAAKPQSQDDGAASSQQEGQAGGKPAGEGAGAGSGGSGSGSGGGAGSGDGGKGSGAGAGGGSPFGGTPAAGSSGAGFASPDSGATHAMGATGLAPGSTGGAGLGGVGALGGDHERSLSAKSAAGGLMGSRPVVNVNGLAGPGAGQGPGAGGMGGFGGMGGAHGGQGAGKERKTPDYLKGVGNGQELLGGDLPVAGPDVVGALSAEEIAEAEAERAEAEQERLRQLLEEDGKWDQQ